MDNERPDLELSVQNMDRRRKDHEQSVSTDPAQLGNRNRIAARIFVLPRSVRNLNLLVPMYHGRHWITSLLSVLGTTTTASGSASWA